MLRHDGTPRNLNAPRSSPARRSRLPGTTRTKRSPRSATPRSTNAVSPGSRTTAAEPGLGRTHDSNVTCWIWLEPYHVGQFMSDDGDGGFFIPVGRSLRIVQQVGLPVRHQTPVLHRTKIKVRQRDLIWNQRFKSDKQMFWTQCDVLGWNRFQCLKSAWTSFWDSLVQHRIQ